jgi:hypothetical protein
MTTGTAAIVEGADIAAASGAIPGTAAITEGADILRASGAVAPPVTITATQSYSHVIRNVFFDVLAGDSFFAGYTCRKNKMLVVRPEYLPYLGVYIIDETMSTDGDGNAGEIRFIHALRIGFSVMVANNDQDALELQLDAAFWRIMNRLWPDEYIMNVIDTYNPHTGTGNPDNTRIESIERGLRRYAWGTASFNNETPLGELQYDITCRYRTYWSPGPFDDLDTIDVVTGIKPGDTQGEMDARQQLHVQYNFGTTPNAMTTPIHQGYSRASFAAKQAQKSRMQEVRQDLRDYLAKRSKGHGHSGR